MDRDTAIETYERWSYRGHAWGAGTVLVKFDSYEGRTPCGTLLDLAHEQPFSFRGLDQMLLIMDDIMDEDKHPFPSFDHRYLGKDAYVFRKLDGEEAGRTDRPQPFYRADLFLRVDFRQYASMQGEMAVMRKQGSQRVRFRSSLELMRLIHEYLDRKEEER